MRRWVLLTVTALLACPGPTVNRVQPQLRVPAGHWQSAATLGAWTLVGSTVSPAFRFEGFELAPPHWEPPTAS